MRVGIVRTDLGNGVYIADVESRVQRCFSHEPPGQSRNIRRPTDQELLDALHVYPVATPDATLLAALKAAVYPTPVTIDVSQATIIAVDPGFGVLPAPDQAALALSIADLVAPELVETPMVITSFAIGIISKMRVATFQPYDLPAGIAAAVVMNDGVTPYTP